jgi:hypothetical protein
MPRSAVRCYIVLEPHRPGSPARVSDTVERLIIHIVVVHACVHEVDANFVVGSTSRGVRRRERASPQPNTIVCVLKPEVCARTPAYRSTSYATPIELTVGFERPGRGALPATKRLAGLPPQRSKCVVVE